MSHGSKLSHLSASPSTISMHRRVYFTCHAIPKKVCSKPVPVTLTPRNSGTVSTHRREQYSCSVWLRSRTCVCLQFRSKADFTLLLYRSSSLNPSTRCPTSSRAQNSVLTSRAAHYASTVSTNFTIKLHPNLHQPPLRPTGMIQQHHRGSAAFTIPANKR